MPDQVLTAILCQTRFREPLATVDLPGLGAELAPAQLRALADTLRRVADEAEAQPMEPCAYRCKERTYLLRPD